MSSEPFLYSEEIWLSLPQSQKRVKVCLLTTKYVDSNSQFLLLLQWIILFLIFLVYTSVSLRFFVKFGVNPCSLLICLSLRIFPIFNSTGRIREPRHETFWLFYSDYASRFSGHYRIPILHNNLHHPCFRLRAFTKYTESEIKALLLDFKMKCSCTETRLIVFEFPEDVLHRR